MDGNFVFHVYTTKEHQSSVSAWDLAGCFMRSIRLGVHQSNNDHSCPGCFPVIIVSAAAAVVQYNGQTKSQPNPRLPGLRLSDICDVQTGRRLFPVETPIVLSTITTTTCNTHTHTHTHGGNDVISEKQRHTKVAANAMCTRTYHTTLQHSNP